MIRNIASHSAYKTQYLKYFNTNDVLTDYKFATTGSSALIKLLEAKGLSAGDTILVPSFICDSVTFALDYAGYKIIFVEPEVNQLWPSVHLLEHITTDHKIDAVIFVEYFGFEIRKFGQLFEVFEQKHIPIIIDRCHSCLIETDYDSRIQNKIFSFSKSFPVYPLGAYEIKNSLHLSNSNSDIQFLFFLIKNFFISNLFSMRHWGLSLFTIKDQIERIYPKPMPSKRRINLEYPGVTGAIVAMLTDQTFILKCRKRRRSCYRILARYAENIGLDFLKLSANDVPQAFVIRDDSPSLVNSLRSHGIGAYRWPNQNLPEIIRRDLDLYPNANRLGDSFICIPLHEDLKLPDLNWIMDVLTALKGNSK